MLSTVQIIKSNYLYEATLYYYRLNTISIKMSSAIVNSTAGPRSLEYQKEISKITRVYDPLTETLSRRIREAPYYNIPNFSTNSDATWGKRGVSYQIIPESQLYNSVYDMLEHNIGAPGVADPGTTYTEAPGLRMIERVEFRIGTETIVRLDYAGLFMWMLMQDPHVRDVYLRGVLYGTTHDNAEFAAAHEFAISLPNAFDHIINTLKTRRISQKIEYVVDYAAFANVVRNIGASTPGAITQNHVEYSEVDSLRHLIEKHADERFQELNIITYDIQNDRIAGGSATFNFQVAMPKRIRKIFFYITDNNAVDPNFAPVALTDWYFMIGNAKFPRYGLTPIRNKIMLAENMRTDFNNLEIYGWVFEHAAAADDTDEYVQTANFDLVDIPILRIVGNFPAAIANDHTLHVLYEIDGVLKVDSQGILKMS